MIAACGLSGELTLEQVATLPANEQDVDDDDDDEESLYVG